MSSNISQMIVYYFAKLKPNSVRSYDGSLRAFKFYLEQKGIKFEEATKNNVLDYIADLRSKKLADATIKREYGALSGIYSMLARERLVPGNPFAEAKYLLNLKHVNPVRPTAEISEVDVRRLLSAPDEHSVVGKRDRAILALLFGGGLRRSEVAALEIEDVKEAKGGMLLMLRDTKAGGTKEQSVAPWVADRVKKWLDVRPYSISSTRSANYESVTADKGPLFLQGLTAIRAKPLKPAHVYAIFKRYSRRLIIRGSPHSLRAAVITELFEKGEDVAKIQAFARHADIKTTLRYHKRIQQGLQIVASSIKENLSD